MARRGVLGMFAVGAAALLGGCWGSSVSYRYRMTVEVDTPEGIKTGSSVMEVRLARGMAIGDQSGVTSGVFGEAVVVDLPNGPLFVLLQLPDAGGPLQDIVPHALLGRRSDGPDGAMADGAKLGSTWFSEYRAEFPRTRDNGSQFSNNNWPMMVRFADINDPTSVERVDPDAIGVKRILLETTSDDVTTGIGKRLGWLSRQRGSLVKRDAGNFGSSPPLGVTLTEMDFSSEVGK